MPSLFGRHLLDKVVFLTLDQVAADLPPLTEEVLAARWIELAETMRSWKRIDDRRSRMMKRGNR